MESKQVKRIMYVIVLPAESSAILEKNQFRKETTLSSEYSNIFEVYTCKESEEREVIIIRPIDDPLHSTALFGTEISFFVTYMGIKLFSPDVVISMGYAGEACQSEHTPMGIGAVVIAKDKSVYHRREMIVKYYENTSFGFYPLHTCEGLVKQCGFHSHSVGTSNSFVRHDHVAIAKDIRVVEMELCSVARGCFYFKTPCIGVKIISDGGSKEELSEEERVKQFLDSLPLLRDKFNDTYEKVNKYLFGKTVEEF